jgi:hypothetical protein
MRASFIDENGTVFRVLEERPETESLEEMVRARWKGRPQMIGDYLFRRQPLVDAGGYYDLPYAWCSDDISVFRAAREKGIENPKDYNLRLDISDKALNALQQRDPTLAARLNFRLEGYDRELAKAHLPYIGTAYDLRHRELPPEQVPTQEISMQDDKEDLPF